MESVYNVYSLLLMDISSVQDLYPSDAALDQFLFYTDANRGILGRISLPSKSRLANGPYVGDQHSADNVCIIYILGEVNVNLSNFTGV